MRRFGEKDVELLEREEKYRGFFKLDALTVRHRLFSGEMSPPIMREVVLRDDAVAVLAYDPKLDKLLFVEQFRAPLVGKSTSPWTIEIIAGMIDSNESAESVVHREAKEEAGIEFDELIPIQSYFSSTGGSSEKLHLYLGLCDLKDAGGFFGLEEEGEDIRAFTLSREEAFKLLDEGKLHNAATIITLLWFKLNYREYRRD